MTGIIDMASFLEGLDSIGQPFGPRVCFCKEAPVVYEVFSADEYDRRGMCSGSADGASSMSIDGTYAFIPRFRRSSSCMSGLILGLISPYLSPCSMLSLTQTCKSCRELFDSSSVYMFWKQRLATSNILGISKKALLLPFKGSLETINHSLNDFSKNDNCCNDAQSSEMKSAASCDEVFHLTLASETSPALQSGMTSARLIFDDYCCYYSIIGSIMRVLAEHCINTAIAEDMRSTHGCIGTCASIRCDLFLFYVNFLVKHWEEDLISEWLFRDRNRYCSTADLEQAACSTKCDSPHHKQVNPLEALFFLYAIHVHNRLTSHQTVATTAANEMQWSVCVDSGELAEAIMPSAQPSDFVTSNTAQFSAESKQAHFTYERQALDSFANKLDLHMQCKLSDDKDNNIDKCNSSSDSDSSSDDTSSSSSNDDTESRSSDMMDTYIHMHPISLHEECISYYTEVFCSSFLFTEDDNLIDEIQMSTMSDSDVHNEPKGALLFSVSGFNGALLPRTDSMQGTIYEALEVNIEEGVAQNPSCNTRGPMNVRNHYCSWSNYLQELEESIERKPRKPLGGSALTLERTHSNTCDNTESTFSQSVFSRLDAMLEQFQTRGSYVSETSSSVIQFVMQKDL